MPTAADSSMMFTDLSGHSTTPSNNNPYNALLEACDQDPQQIQDRYQTHRESRNAQQKATLLSPTFPGFSIDPILDKLLHDRAYVDPRNCLVFWARPPSRIRSLVSAIQHRLLRIAPSLWLMPLEKLHLTSMEVIHSTTSEEITRLVDTMGSAVPAICDYPSDHRCRLVKPALGFDAAAIALTFLPATAAAAANGKAGPREDDAYTYHHFRRDLYDMCATSGVEVASRYVLPSAHLTVARFTDQDLYEKGRVGELVAEMERVNAWLRETAWGKEEEEGDGEGSWAGEWVVGEGKGLVCRKMKVWYGDGESEYEGRGFAELDES